MKIQAPVAAQAQQKTQAAQARPETGPAFQDKRPGMAAMARLQAAAADSPRLAQLKTLQAMADASLQVRQRQSVQAAVEASDPNGTGLPDGLKAGIENLSGMNLDHVRVHYNSARPAQLQAHAYAQGSEIHVAPGQEKHLPHEAWHVVQQAQGRVRPTVQMKGDVPVNDDAGLEREADIMGEKALAAGPATIQARQTGLPAPATGGAPAAQLKSVIKSTTPKKSGADTPLKTLHDNFGALMTAAGLPSQYRFQNALPSVMHNDARYAGSQWDKAGTVEAELDSASRSKADGSNRDNSVIGPYGHFGVMERAIFQRPDVGNAYDGGHLVEHTLMEGQDADIHGNLAPQENKNFNQGLMRGWESIAERYMDSYHGKWNYKVDLVYTDDSYDCTGADLIAAGVIPKLAETNLAKLATPRDAELTGKTVSFERWIPHEWKATISRVDGTDLPHLLLTHGAHMHNLVDTHQKARDEVFTTHATAPLLRTNSGTLGGFFSNYGMVSGSANTAMVGGTGVTEVSAFMYQPVPQPFLFQPFATSTPSGKVPVVMPPTSQTVNTLKKDVSLSTLESDLLKVPLKNANTKRNLAAASVVRKARLFSPDFQELSRLFGNDEERAIFIKAVVYSPDSLSKMTWPTVIAGVPGNPRRRLQALLLDPKLKP
jgi:hypothetical protein